MAKGPQRFKDPDGHALRKITLWTSGLQKDIAASPSIAPAATGAVTWTLVDNLASALDVTESTNSYLKFVTTNGSEAVALSKKLTLLDSVNIVLGTGADDTIGHDGTLTTWTHAVGDLVIDNTDVNDQIILRTGTDTNATGVEIRNNSDAAYFKFEPASATAGTLSGPDNSSIVLGTGSDLTILHNATDTIFTSTTGWLQFDSTAVTTGMLFDLGTDTNATRVSIRNNTGNALFSVFGDGTIGLGTAKTQTIDISGKQQMQDSGTGTGFVAEQWGTSATEGWQRVVYEATISPNAIENALLTVPAGSIVEGVWGNVEALLVGGGTSVTWSIGITGDVDCYGTCTSDGYITQADGLTKNSKWSYVAGVTPLSNRGASIGLFSASAVDMKLIAAATGGATAGDTVFSAGSFRVRVQYITALQMDNAA